MASDRIKTARLAYLTQLRSRIDSIPHQDQRCADPEEGWYDHVMDFIDRRQQSDLIDQPKEEG